MGLTKNNKQSCHLQHPTELRVDHDILVGISTKLSTVHTLFRLSDILITLTFNDVIYVGTDRV